MPIITKISVQQKNKHRANIHVEGKYLFSLNISTVLQNKLKVNNHLSTKDLDNLVIESDGEKILAKIINFLSYRPRSEKEVKDRLRRYSKKFHHTHHTISIYVIDYLTQHKLINDKSFSVWFITQRQSYRPRSRRHLYSELFLKGIKKDTIDTALQETEFDETEELLKLLKKKNLDATQHSIEYLLRKGFSYNMIKENLS